MVVARKAIYSALIRFCTAGVVAMLSSNVVTGNWYDSFGIALVCETKKHLLQYSRQTDRMAGAERGKKTERMYRMRAGNWGFRLPLRRMLVSDKI